MEARPALPQTRSGAHYTTADEWIYRNPKFIQSFGKACDYFKTNQPIPQDLLERLESFTISRREYYEYIYRETRRQAQTRVPSERKNQVRYFHSTTAWDCDWEYPNASHSSITGQHLHRQ